MSRHIVDSCEALPAFANVVPTVHRIAAGGILFRRGAKTQGIFRLVKGRIRLVRTTADGAEVSMHTAQPGELFAEASLFSARYHCDALALKDSEVLFYAKAALERQLKMHPQAIWAFAAEMAHRIQGLRTQLEIRQIRSARQRVLQALHVRSDEAGRWKPAGTLKQFAEEIGLTHEALYRAMAALEKEGYIQRHSGEIALLGKRFWKSDQAR
jgi:CRP-like cAMP-binding protein